MGSLPLTPLGSPVCPQKICWGSNLQYLWRWPDLDIGSWLTQSSQDKASEWTPNQYVQQSYEKKESWTHTHTHIHTHMHEHHGSTQTLEVIAMWRWPELLKVLWWCCPKPRKAWASRTETREAGSSQETPVRATPCYTLIWRFFFCLRNCGRILFFRIFFSSCIFVYTWFTILC